MQAIAGVELNGELSQGALIRAKVEPGTEVFLNDEVVKVNDKGEFVFGFARDAQAEQMLKLVYADGLTELKPLKVKPREYKIQNITGISKKIMKPDPKAQARAAEDSKQVKAARAQFTASDAFNQDFIWPLTGRVTGVYGSQRIYNGKPGTPHYGVDIAAKTGTVVVAPADGVISLSVPDMFYSGGTMIIDHGYGVSSSFLHLSKLYVEPGQVVKQGDKVAEVGSTGRSTGPHLDWRVNWYQVRLDPTTVVPSMKSVLAKQQ
ncbi:M23 family metallopeptidase [Shewanella sp. 1CM18E]|uniref:M23 family metallopeptidase n=1 Tax=Shewanella sp. 1CM18E TaxID=2929169 RepID=UPI0020BFE3CB|nr:M23 family metallopeptidase [Shewanella sp. 1CM18E]MCK8046634.1 M23 family metallopeptidase [Shewanella sp. 1CM18E]